jgi:hypothetical protein
MPNSIGKNGSYHQIRDQWYYIEITLWNQIQGQKPLNVPMFFVDSLRIHETLFHWYVKGEIVFNTDFEIFSRGSLVTSGTYGTKDIKPPYIDRTDGRNRLHITIYPVDVKNENGTVQLDTSSGNKFPKKYWEMDMDFVIVDVQDLPVDNAQKKKRMYIFVSENYQILKEKNLEWSSAMFAGKLHGVDPTTIKDEVAAINPHDSLKQFLTLVSTNGDTMPKINVGFNSSGSIDNPNIPFDHIDTSNFDAGDPSNNVLLYSPADSKGHDDLFYILSHCSSSDGYPVIFDYGRSSEDKGWQLKSLSAFFKNANQEQVERLIIEDGLQTYNNGGTNPPPYIPRADFTGASPTKNFTSFLASRITSYKFSPMNSIDDNRIVNSPLVYFDEHKGEFNFKKEKNTVKAVIDKLNNLAKMGLYTFQKGNGQILLNLNKTKSSGQMTEHKLALNGPYSSQSSPVNQMILDVLFLNQSVSFQAPGLTLRAPGKFIFLDRVGAGELNAFDDRFLGQWLVTNVSHLFTQGDYVTEVVATKVDSYSPIYPTGEESY